MTVPRLVAIAVILALATGAWMILVGSVEYRTSSSRSDLTERVEGLWGGPQAQQAVRVGPAHRDRGVAASQEPTLEPAQLDRLHEGVGRRMPAARKTDVGAPGASLQEPLGVVRIVDQSMIGLPDLPSRLEGVGRHLQAFYLDHVRAATRALR